MRAHVYPRDGANEFTRSRHLERANGAIIEKLKFAVRSDTFIRRMREALGRLYIIRAAHTGVRSFRQTAQTCCFTSLEFHHSPKGQRAAQSEKAAARIRENKGGGRLKFRDFIPFHYPAPNKNVLRVRINIKT